MDKPGTIGADELFWRGVLDSRDRALDRRWWGSRDEFSGADGSIGVEEEPAATAPAY
jgi:hypothetical protein